MKLSVIIPCYNAARTIGDQLEALARERWSEPWEIIVADNGSTDDSLAVVERYLDRLPNLRIVRSPSRRGPAHTRNAGAAAARGEALAFVDADDLVGEGWLRAMGEALARHDFVACRYDASRLNPTWAQRIHSTPQADGLQPYTHPPFLPHAGGSSLGVKRALHQAIGGFDESLPQLEDTDYCWRAQLAGAPLCFVPDAVVHIRYRLALRGIFNQARGYARYNVLLYKRYRAQGMPQLSPKKGLSAWGRLLKRLLRIRNRQALARWLWNFGWSVGRLQGSIAYRVLAL